MKLFSLVLIIMCSLLSGKASLGKSIFRTVPVAKHKQNLLCYVKIASGFGLSSQKSLLDCNTHLFSSWVQFKGTEARI